MINPILLRVVQEAIVAASAQIRERLGWVPRHDDLDGIVRQALGWEAKLTELRKAG